MAADARMSSRLVDRFGLVLVAVSVTVGVLLTFDMPRQSSATTAEEVAVTVLTAITLILALLVSGARRPFFNVAVVTGAVFIAWSVISFFAHADSVGFLRWFWFLLVVATPFVVLRRLASHREVTAQTLLGAASVYLLIAVAFMFLYLGIDGFEPGQFFGQSEPTTAFMYFSLVTITTLGYGDLSPVTETARAAASATAIVGQIYLVFVVARMVGLYTFAVSTGPMSADEPEQSN
jgi:hypothetical protein